MIKINVDVALPATADFFWVSLVAMATYLAIKEALDRGWPQIIIETDCFPMYMYLVDGRRSLISYGATLDSCLDLCYLFQSISFSFVKRFGNSVAHAIATANNLSCNEGCSLPSSLSY